MAKRRRQKRPHDRAVRWFLRLKGVVEALLRHYLPRATVREMAGPPVTIPGSFIDESLREHVTDLLVRVPLRGRENAFVYCLIEHKRTPGRAVMFQMLRYLAQIYERLAQQFPSSRVPCVVPLVIYNGDRPWAGPRHFRDVVETQGSPRGALDFTLQLIDLAATPIDAIPRERSLRGGLLALKVAATPLRDRERLIIAALDALDDESTRGVFVRYIAMTGTRSVVRIAAQKQEQQVETFAEYYERKGRKQGLKDGRQRGREEALREAAGTLLRLRFKRLTPGASRKLADASAKTLKVWIARAVEAPSLAAVFAEER